MIAALSVKNCLLIVLLFVSVSFAKETNEPVLCRTVECNMSNVENENSKAAASQSANVIYIVVFKSAKDASTVSKKELLGEFNKNHPKRVNTHHFRLKQSKEETAGRVCVDGREGRDAIVEMIAKNGNLVLLSAEPATNQQLKELDIVSPSYQKSSKETIFKNFKGPVVVRTSPQTFVDDLDPSLKEIAVTFDQPMMDNSWSWTGDSRMYPETTGQPSYDKDMKTCRVPVKLEPGMVYWVGINNPSYQNFKNNKGEPAKEYVILFATKSQQGKPTQIPEDMKKEAQAVNYRVREPETDKTAAKSMSALSFTLLDTRGREIRSEDYAGVPVLIMCGSCWCGGCQQDAEPLRRIAEQYLPRGLGVIRSVSGDNELAAMDFAKHYRLDFPQIMDTNREFERRYNEDGWTFLMLADSGGRVVFKCNNPGEEDWSAIRHLAGNMVKSENANQTTIVDGVRYMNKTLKRSGEIQKAKRRDELASIACADNNRIYVIFTSNRNGNNDIFVRTFNGTQWSEDKPIAATKADEYDGTIIVDSNNRAWAAWTSNAEGGKYGIYVTAITESGEPCEPKIVSIGVDDSMHARLACDKNGDVWAAYYKWQDMGGRSRDKEVFVRRLSKGQWSRQVQVSPTDVPDYEDHTEPVIACYGNGAVVCWSWDFHQPKGYTKDALNPTIFISSISSDLEPARPAVISAKDIDVTPSIGIIKGQIWCVWDSLRWDGRLKTYRKSVCLAKAAVLGWQNSTEILTLNEPAVNVCTPTIATGKDGRACIVWSETEDGNKWVLKMADFDAQNNQWKKPTSIEPDGNPRFCSADYDNQGKLWVAYSIQTQDGRRIAVKQL